MGIGKHLPITCLQITLDAAHHAGQSFAVLECPTQTKKKEESY